MRKLTLDEKISIKGELATKPHWPGSLVDLTMHEACDRYYRCFGRSVAFYGTRQLTRKKPCP